MSARPPASAPADAPGKAGFVHRMSLGLGLGARLARALRPYAYGCRPQMFAAAGLGLAFLVFRLAQPWPLKWVIDGLTGHHKNPVHTNYVELGLAYIVLSAAAGFADYGQRRLVAGLANRVVFRFRSFLFSHLLNLPLAYQERRGAGELLTRIVWDTARLRRGLYGILLRMFQSTAIFIATVGVLAWLSPLLACVVLVTGLAAFATMLTTNRKILDAARLTRRREGRLSSVIEEDLRGAPDLQTYGRSTDRRFDEQNQKSLRGEQKLVRYEAGLLLRVEVLMALSICLILWLGSQSVVSGRTTAGHLVLFIHYSLSLYGPFTQFARQASQAGRTAACAERLLKIAARPPAVVDGAVPAPPLAGEIVFENVRVQAPQRARGGRRWSLNGVSFRIAPGERVAILGLNGAGKSTAFKHLLRLQDPFAGRILVDGRDIRDYTMESFRSQFSVVNQPPALFGLSVRENVAMGRPGASDAEILAALETAGAGEFVRRLPKQLDTIVRGARIFSAGERQRLALARAILRAGRIWLLDEPTTALDHPEELERTLLRDCVGSTVLWITHDVPTACRMDRVLVFADGKVVFTGSPEELQAFLSGEVAGPASRPDGPEESRAANGTMEAAMWLREAIVDGGDTTS